ncbi:hypothetical protein BDW66DRAFT_130424 [Aspergillus desertorum]
MEGKVPRTDQSRLSLLQFPDRIDPFVSYVFGRTNGTNMQTPHSRVGDDTAKSCVHFALPVVSVLADQPT